MKSLKVGDLVLSAPNQRYGIVISISKSCIFKDEKLIRVLYRGNKDYAYGSSSCFKKVNV